MDEFRSYWLNNESSVTRDMASLMTGRDLDGSTIGLAFTGVVCTNAAYGLSQSRYTTNAVNRIALTAHEVGHNWSSPHCDAESLRLRDDVRHDRKLPRDAVWRVELDKITTHHDSRELPVADGAQAGPGREHVARGWCDARAAWADGRRGAGVGCRGEHDVVHGVPGDDRGGSPGRLDHGASFTTPPLQAGTTYRWRIDSNGAGGTTLGIEWSFTTEYAR